jgi:oxygen-independent coproporphyrinogen-3 oxidase
MRAYISRCETLLRAAPHQWNTLYIGGGTPSALPPALLARLLAAAGQNLLPGAEVTVEMNPSSASLALCEACAAGGVNRVSLGVQAIAPAQRKALGRAAGPEEIVRALGRIRAAGINNISLDVMLGIPGQTEETLEETLRFCETAGATHISAYLLSIEEGTRFYDRPPDGLPDEDAQAQLYLHCCAWLERHGFAQYEISNFCRPGFESRHNLAYWRCEEYNAVGPGAHGYTNGRRWHYPRDLEDFLRGAAPADDGPGGDDEERAMLALRLTAGIRQPSDQMLARAAQLPPGLAIADERGLRLTPKGFLASNRVIGLLLGY